MRAVFLEFLILEFKSRDLPLSESVRDLGFGCRVPLWILLICVLTKMAFHIEKLKDNFRMPPSAVADEVIAVFAKATCLQVIDVALLDEEDLVCVFEDATNLLIEVPNR